MPRVARGATIVQAAPNVWDRPEVADRLGRVEGDHDPASARSERRDHHRYGIYNEGGPRGRGIPHRRALIVDKAGTIRYLSVDEDYRVRPSIDELLEALAKVRRP